MKLALEIDRDASVLILVEALKEQLSSEGIEHGQDLRLYEVRKKLYLTWGLLMALFLMSNVSIEILEFFIFFQNLFVLC